jgi:hypothetical protein
MQRAVINENGNGRKFKMRYSLIALLLLASARAFAASVECDLVYNYAIGQPSVHQIVALNLVDGSGDKCITSKSVAIPNSDVVVSIGGYGKCSSTPAYGCKSDTSIGLIEVFDKRTNVYTETNWGCEPAQSAQLQFLGRGADPINVLVECSLKLN